MNEESVRLVYCSKCHFSDKHNTETTTGKPFCTNWGEYLDCGCIAYRLDYPGREMMLYPEWSYQKLK